MSATNKDTSSSTTPQFIAALVTGLIVVGALTALWAVLHGKKNYRKVFQPRVLLAPEAKRPHELPSNPIGFWKTVLRTPDTDIIIANGLDAYFFVRFLKVFGLQMLVPYVVLTISVCVGVSAAKPNAGQSGLNKLTFGNVALDKQVRHVAHFVVSVVLIFWTMFLIWREYNHYVEMRQQWMTSPQHLTLARSRTVALTNVPDGINSETGMKELAGTVAQLTGRNQANASASRISDATYVAQPQKGGELGAAGGVRSVWLTRKVKEVEKVWEERDNECMRLEGGVAKLVKLGNKNYRKGKTPEKKGTYDAENSTHMVDRFVLAKKRPTWKQGLLGLIGKKMTLDTSPIYIKEHNDLLATLRAKEDELPQGNTTFVRFGSQAEAHAFAKLASSTPGNKLVQTSIEVVPEDVQWSNISLNPYERKVRTMISWALTIGLIIVWAPIITFVGMVSNVDSLCQKASWLAWLCTIPPAVLGIIKGILPPVLFAVVFMVLPIILRIFIRLQGEVRKSDIDLKLFSRFWLFQVIHGFLIITLASGLINSLSHLGNTANSVPTLLAQNLPGASVFFLTFFLTATFSSAAQSYSRVKPFVFYLLRGILAGGTPRKFYFSEYKMGSFAWGTAWPPVCLLVCLTVVYSVIQPIMCVLAIVAFALMYAAWSYILMWTADQPDALETGGQYYIKALRTVFVSLYIEEICLAGLFFLSKDQNNKLPKSATACGALMIVMIVLTALFQAYIDWRAFPKSYLYYVHASTSRTATESKLGAVQTATSEEYDTAGPEYGNTSGFHERAFDHPALWKKQPCVWIANDPLGIGKFEAERINEVGVEASTAFASMDDKGKLHVERSPPDEAWYGGFTS